MFDPIPVPTNLTWKAGQCAVALGMGEGRFKKLLPQFEAAGFPRRLPAMNAWPRWAVIDWINSSAGTYAGHNAVAPLIPEADAEIDAIVSELEGTYTSAPQLRRVA